MKRAMNEVAEMDFKEGETNYVQPQQVDEPNKMKEQVQLQETVQPTKDK